MSWLINNPSAIFGIGFTIIVNSLTIGFIYANILGRIGAIEIDTKRIDRIQIERGGQVNRISHIEEGVRRLDNTVLALSTLVPDVAVIKSQISSIAASQARVERLMDRIPENKRK